MTKEKVLQSFGLTEAEVKVYLSMLMLGEATASQISDRTNTNRTFTYDRIKKLMDSGLLSYVIKDNKKYFKAADPGHLLELLRQREEQVREVLPELQKLRVTPPFVPQVEVFSSKKGIRTVLNLLLREGKTIHIHGSLRRFKEIMESYYNIWNKRRARERIKAKVLTDEIERIDFAEVDLLSEEAASITTFTCGDKVVIAAWADQPVAIMIQSEEMAKDSILFFNNIWEREIKIYSGIEGIKKAFMELVERKTSEHIGFGYSWALAQVYGREFSDEWHIVRMKNGIASKLISYDDKDSKKYFRKRMIKWKDFHIRFLSRDLCGPACVTLSDHLIVTFIYTEKRLKVIVNSNRETISVYKKYFRHLWRNARGN